MLRIGTRGSRLALWQANFVAEQLRTHINQSNRPIRRRSLGFGMIEILSTIAWEVIFNPFA